MLPLPPGITLPRCPPPTQSGPPSGAAYLSPRGGTRVPTVPPTCHAPCHPAASGTGRWPSSPSSATVRHPSSDFCPPRPTLLPSLPLAPPAGWHRAAFPAQRPPGADGAWSPCPCTHCRRCVPWEKDKPLTFPDRLSGGGLCAAVGTGTDPLQQHLRARAALGRGQVKVPFQCTSPASRPASPAPLHARSSCIRRAQPLKAGSCLSAPVHPNRSPQLPQR